MRKNKKRYLKSIGTLSVMAIPAIAAVSCSNGENKIENAAKSGADKAIKKQFPAPAVTVNSNPAPTSIATNKKQNSINNGGSSKKNVDTSETPQNLKNAYDYLNNKFANDFKRIINGQKQLLGTGVINPIVKTIIDKSIGWKQMISDKNPGFIKFIDENVLKNANAQNALFKWVKIKLSTSINGSNILKFNFQMKDNPDININIDLNAI